MLIPLLLLLDKQCKLKLKGLCRLWRNWTKKWEHESSSYSALLFRIKNCSFENGIHSHYDHFSELKIFWRPAKIDVEQLTD